jgi:alkylation response protein AidB-like acyl-CoA dehydrogenase
MSGLESAMAKVDKIGDLIRDDAAEAERQGFLTPAVVDAVFDADLFRLVVPAEDGGLDLTIPESTEVFERLASFDASTAWTIGILSGGPRIARLIGPDVEAAVHGGRGGLMAATLNPIGAGAIRADGGFRFSGTGSYLSGSAHADWLMVSALEIENDAPVFNNGMISVRSGVIPIAQARSLDTWHVTGMRATNSNDYEFEDVFVADGWHFKPLELGTSPATVFDAIPLWVKLGPALAACGVGTAHNMIERFVDLAGAKMPAGGIALLRDKPTAQIALGEAQSLYQAAHAALLETTREVWALGMARAPFDNEILARHRLGLVAAVRLSAQAIDELHDAAGKNAVAADSVLDRCWRDVHTITQHLVLAPARYEIAGRVLLGLEPGAPVI